MGSVLRDNLNNNWVDPGRKNYVLQEYQHFASIAPKKLFNRKKIAEKSQQMMGQFGFEQPDEPGGPTPRVISTNKAKVIAFFCVILLLPVFSIFVPFLGPIFFIGLAVIVIKYMASRSPEYRNYDFKTRINQAALQSIDDKLFLNFWPNPKDLVDEDMHYDDALVEAHLIRPTKGRCSSNINSCCTYDWMNKDNPDAFEFAGYKIYSEYKDSDNNTHETVYFYGMIFKFRLEHTYQGSINIMSTQTKDTLLGEKEKNKFKHVKSTDIIDTESAEFAANFDTVATYGEEAFYYLTPVMIERLLELHKLYEFCICIKGDVLTLTIPRSQYKNASVYSFNTGKPMFAPAYPDKDIDNMISSFQKSLVSILELKDIVAPRRYD